MTKIGGPNPNIQMNTHKEVVTDAPQSQAYQHNNPTAMQPGVGQQLQGMVGGVVVQQGFIPGAQGTGRSAMGVVNNPGAMLQVAAQGAQQGMQIQAMTGQALQAMNAMGLGNLPQAQMLSMMNGIGQHMVAHANSMGAQALAQTVMPAIPGMNQAAGAFLTSNFNQGMMEGMGGQFLSTIGQQPAVNWGRQALGQLGPQYFNNFDPRSLAAMPNRALMPFTNQMMGAMNQMSPLQMGQQMMPMITPQMQAGLGQGMFNMMAPGMQQSLGQGMMPMLAKAPALAGQALIGGLGQKVLQSIGQKILGQFPGLAGTTGGGLAKSLLGALGKGGDLKKNLLSGITNFFKDKLLKGGKLADLGKNLLGKLGNGFLGKAGNGIMNLIGKGKGALSSLGSLGKGLLGKLGGGVLNKLGGIGNIASGALSLLNGKFDTAKALKIAMNFIPVVGPALGVLSNVPVVGPVINKLVGGIAKVVNKIPGVAPLVKGIGKIGGAIGKGIKKIGKSILGGAKKLFSKI